jgi:hypothetical protein
MTTTAPVTANNFARAETDMYFGMLVKRGGGVGRLDHLRQLHSIEGPGVRPNRDTLYSEAVFDLAAGPVEITLPDPGDRFLSMLVIEEVDPVRHLIATAAGWGLNPDRDAIYLNVTPSGNEGRAVHRLTSPTCRWMASGRSASTTPKATL